MIMSKPKMKTNRAAAKRFKITGSGRVKRGRAYHGHLFTAKSPKRLRNLRKSDMMAACDVSRAKKMLGAG
jgi:large subunit ribosomal protein L35